MQENDQSTGGTQVSPDADAWLAQHITDDPVDSSMEASGEPQSDDQPVEDPGEPSGETPAEGRSEAAQKAERFLALQGLPASMLTTASDEDLVALHQHRAKNEADVTRAFQENAELRRQLEDLRANAEPGEPTATEPGEIPESLTAVLGEEGAQALVQLIQANRSQAPEGLEEIQALAPQLREVVSQGVEEKVKAELRGQFPEIDTRYSDVFDRYQQLAKTDLRGDLEGAARAKALFVDAARIEGLGQSPKPSSEPAPGSTSAQPKGKSVQPKKLTYEQQQDAALALIINEGVTDPAEIKRRVG